MKFSKRSILMCLAVFVSCQISLMSSKTSYALIHPNHLTEILPKTNDFSEAAKESMVNITSSIA